MDFSSLNANDQRQIDAIIARKQMKDSGRFYASLLERCFGSCVDDFTSKALTNKESECVDKCTLKFMKHAERVQVRFQEENLKQMPQQQ